MKDKIHLPSGYIRHNTYHPHSCHYLDNPPSIGLPIEALEQVSGYVGWVVTTHQGRRYRAQLAAFWDYGTTHHNGKSRIVALPLGYWRIDDFFSSVERRQIKQKRQALAQARARTLPLFGEGV